MNIEQLIKMNADLLEKIEKLEIRKSVELQGSKFLQTCWLTEIEDLKIQNEKLIIRVNQLQEEKKTLENVIRNLQQNTKSTYSTTGYFTGNEFTAADAHCGSGTWDRSGFMNDMKSNYHAGGGDFFNAAIVQPTAVTGTTCIVTSVPPTKVTGPFTINPVGKIGTRFESKMELAANATNNTLTNLAPPTKATDAITKSFVEDGWWNDVMVGESMIHTCKSEKSFDDLATLLWNGVEVSKSELMASMGVDQKSINDRKVKFLTDKVSTENSWSSSWDNSPHSSITQY